MTSGIWQEFRAWEDDAADKGSGLTNEQMTGASLFNSWLTERGYLPVRGPIPAKLLRFAIPMQGNTLKKGPA